MAWEPGNLKTDTNTYYNITLFLSVNIRKKLLVSRQISDDIKQFSYEICQRHSVIIRYMETDKGHIHYMIETEPTMSISKIVNLMKSYTTYHIWKRYPQYLRKQFWKEHTFWTDGCFACSVGNVSLMNGWTRSLKAEDMPREWTWSWMWKKEIIICKTKKCKKAVHGVMICALPLSFISDEMLHSLWKHLLILLLIRIVLK